MPFSRRFYPKRLTVMCAYILRMGGPGDRTHYPVPTELQKDHKDVSTLEVNLALSNDERDKVSRDV
jgi:hypothetical protein